MIQRHTGGADPEARKNEASEPSTKRRATDAGTSKIAASDTAKADDAPATSPAGTAGTGAHLGTLV